MSATLSVVIYTHNICKLLRTCLESVVTQKCDPWNFGVVVVDNASTAATEDVALDFWRQTGKVRYVYEGQKGVNRARGTGARAANQVVPVRVVTNLWRPALASFAMALVLVLSQKAAMGWQILFGGFVYLGAVTSLGGLEMEDLRIVTSMFQPSVVSRK